MKKSDFYFDLPPELIAQEPYKDRDQSKLMVIHRFRNCIEHKRFYDIGSYLNQGDALVLNDTKVIPARLYCKNEKNQDI